MQRKYIFVLTLNAPRRSDLIIVPICTVSPKRQQQKTESNFLSGEIPPELSLLSNLEVLSFYDNFLVSTIPTELFAIPTLMGLDLSENELVGEIPTEVGQLANSMWTFDVKHNLLTGHVPFERFTELSNSWLYLSLGPNFFQPWTIPTEIGLLSKLSLLSLEEAHLIGSIPDTLGNCTSMRVLYLENNPELSGTIPTTLARMTDLEKLVMYTNQLSGTVPTEFTAFTNLVHFGMSDSNITGNIFCYIYF